MTNRDRFLHNFQDHTQVLAEDAFIDRFQMSIGDWGLFGTEDQVCETLTRLLQESVMTPEGELIPLFTGDPFISFKQFLNISFKSAKDDNKNTGVAPLISGKIWYADRYRRPVSLREATSRFHFKTTLNLTRFVQAQKFKLKTLPSRPPQLLTRLVLAIAPDEEWFRDEIPLKKSTNLIIGPWTKYAYAKSKPLEKHFSRYLGLVDGLLDRAMSNAAPENAPGHIRQKYYSLREIEIYWEFSCDSSIQFVANALPKIRSIGSSFYERSIDTVYAQEASLKIEDQSPSIKAKIAKGTWLRLYAKTNRRVRFEILLEANIIGEKCGGQTAASRKELTAKLDMLTSYAADKLNAVLPVILAPPAPPSTFPAIRLLSEIHRCCDDRYLAEAIVATLVSFDRIALYNNSPFKDVVHRMHDNGILRTVIPRSRNYCVTDEYRASLEQLRKFVG